MIGAHLGALGPFEHDGRQRRRERDRHGELGAFTDDLAMLPRFVPRRLDHDVVGARFQLGWGVGLCALLGALAGFAVLVTYVLKGRPQAGLPLLNGGTIAGYVLGVLLLGTEWGLNWEFTL